MLHALRAENTAAAHFESMTALAGHHILGCVYDLKHWQKKLVSQIQIKSIEIPKSYRMS
jgi:hypothetical protein